MGFIGWTGDFEDIGLSRWLRRCFADTEPALALTTIEGHRSSAAAGFGIAALPRFVADNDHRLKRIVSDSEPLLLSAWLTLPEALASKRDVRIVVRMIDEAFGKAGLR